MKSIRNYVNTQDFVTGVPLTAWGYDKYGVTEVFESTDYRRNNDAFARAYLSLGKVGMNVNNAGKSAVKNFGKAARNVGEYYNGSSEEVSVTLFGLCYNEIAIGAIIGQTYNWAEKAKLYAKYFKVRKVLVFFGGNADTTIFYSHTPETYYAYISQRW